jgi:hypothetical protein
MLLLKKIYHEPVRRGRKTSTLRYWRYPRVRAGSVHLVPGLGRVLVTDVRQVTPTALRRADAEEDGFASVAELRAALDALHPPHSRKGRHLYQVRFRFLGDGDSSRERPQ